MEFGDFSSSRLMNCCAKFGHVGVLWNVSAAFRYIGDVAGPFDPDTLMGLEAVQIEIKHVSFYIDVHWNVQVYTARLPEKATVVS